jgi:hypothetical protein
VIEEVVINFRIESIYISCELIIKSCNENYEHGVRNGVAIQLIVAYFISFRRSKS